jgi:hypothetical protein
MTHALSDQQTQSPNNAPIPNSWRAIPIERGFALLVLFAGDIVEEVVVTRVAAAILRRAWPLPAEKLRIDRSRFGGLEFLDDDPVLPVVAHVVDVTDLSYADGKQCR